MKQRFSGLCYGILRMFCPVMLCFFLTWWNVPAQSENTDENISVMVNYSFMASRIQVSAARNTFTYFSGELKAAISHETEMISKIQKALVNDEFSILFRPKYDIASRTLVGGEVKCHWVDHEGKTYENRLPDTCEHCPQNPYGLY